VDFINIFQVYRNMFWQMVAIFRGVVGALEATQVVSVLWAYTDYDPSIVASCRGTATGQRCTAVAHQLASLRENRRSNVCYRPEESMDKYTPSKQLLYTFR
jgi:hypothetical protein